jgi:hypothetical protein
VTGAGEVYRAPVGRVGVVAAVVWIALGLGLAFVSSRLGAQQLAGPLALLAGPAALAFVGRRHDLHRGRDWLVAGAIALAIGWVLAGLGACIAAIALYG